MEDLEKRVIKELNPHDVISLTRDMVKLDTVNPPGNEKQMVELISSRMKRQGFTVEVDEVFPDRPNVIVTLEGTSSKPTLIFNGHMDVVPVGEGWTVDPFGAVVKDGKMYGRGTVDMKGGLASLMVAMEALRKSKVELCGTLKLTAVVDEEGHATGTRRLTEKGLKGDFAIFAEATDLKIGAAQKGWTLFTITTYGKKAHASTPNKGVNAILWMNEIINKIKEYDSKLGKRMHTLLGCPTVNIGMIEGGVKSNIVPDRCKIEVDRRLIPGESINDVVRDFGQIISELERENTKFSADMKLEDDAVEAIETPFDAPIIKALQLAIPKITNKDAEFMGLSGTSDSAYFTHTPSVIFGPGDFRLAHVADEYVEIEQLVKAAKINALVALNLLS